MNKSPCVDWKVKLRVRHHSVRWNLKFLYPLTILCLENITEIDLFDWMVKSCTSSWRVTGPKCVVIATFFI